MLHALTYMEHTSFAMQITVVVPDSMHFSQEPTATTCKGSNMSPCASTGGKGEAYEAQETGFSE